MKTIYRTIIFLFVLSFAAGCEIEEPLKEEVAATVELTAQMEVDVKTRTSLSGLNGGMYYPLWSSNDEIAVYVDGESSYSKFTLKSGEETTEALFSGTREGKSYYAIYPCSIAGSFQNGTISLALPQTQHYIANSFGPDSYPMVAQSTDGRLDFKNLCAVMKISITGESDVYSITLRANDSKAFLAGDAVVVADYGDAPFLKMLDEGYNSIKLNCDGVRLSQDKATDFYLVIPAQEYAGGFTVEVDVKTEVVTKSVPGNLTFKRSQIRHLKGMNLDTKPNNAPSKPAGLKPGNNEEGVSTMPTFSWNASVDADGDDVVYKVHLSEDGSNWKQIEAGCNTTTGLSLEYPILEPGVRYHYKVSADDGRNGGYVESETQTFTVTPTRDAYEDGGYILHTKSAKANPVTLIFTGDGYLPEHFKYGGQFDKDTDDAIDGFFSLEPYKSYKEYFTIYKLAAYSNETGITNKATNDNRDTKFKLEWEGGRSTGISCNYDLVLEWAMKIPGVDGNVLRKGAIGVISNADVYAGTCTSYNTGMSISMIPYLRNASTGMTSFKNVVAHEMGGHGFGRLGDEYMSYNQQAPSDRINQILNLQNWMYPFYVNLSVYPEQCNSLWAHFEGLEDYSHVGMFEGGGLYTKGIWRAEQISCMNDNRLYYNSPSRFYIVKRILEIAGEIEPYSSSDSPEVKAQKIAKAMEIFLQKDVQKTDNTQTNTKTWGGVPYDFVPLGETVFIEEE